jgi:hypothetical protein
MCAVINLGMGDARWDCRYRTAKECVPNLIAGDRGSCSLNPYGPAAMAVPVKRTYKHHVRRDQGATLPCVSYWMDRAAGSRLIGKIAVKGGGLAIGEVAEWLKAAVC